MLLEPSAVAVVHRTVTKTPAGELLARPGRLDNVAGVVYLGVDLAWGDTSETGLVALDDNGTILDADWRSGTTATGDWICGHAEEDTLCFIDAPLIVTLSECYPYTTLVGATELGHDRERPTYKRRPRSVSSPGGEHIEQWSATT